MPTTKKSNPYLMHRGLDNPIIFRYDELEGDKEVLR